MAYRYFHEQYAINREAKAHMSVMDGDKAIQLPIVGGVIRIPDELHSKVVMPPGWVKYTGQVPCNDEELQPIEDVDKHYNGAKKATK